MVLGVVCTVVNAQTFTLKNERGGDVTYEVTAAGEVGLRLPNNIASYNYDIVVPESVEYGGNVYEVTSVLPVLSGGGALGGGLYLNENIVNCNLSNMVATNVFPKRQSTIPKLTIEEGLMITNLVLTTDLSAYKTAWAEMYQNVFFMPFDGNGDTTRATMTKERYGYYADGVFLAVELQGTNDENAEVVNVKNYINVGGITYNYVMRIAPGAFAGNEKIREITLPMQLIEIGARAFAGAVNLETVTTKSNLHVIGDGAFEGCQSLQNLVLNGNVTSIGEHAFDGCSELRHLYFNNQSGVPELGENAFDGVEVGTLTVHFPEELRADVMADNRWMTLFEAQGATPVYEAREADERGEVHAYEIGTGRAVTLDGKECGLFVVKDGKSARKYLFQ